jgi:3-hydroxyisobutyrate dehydrogenase
VPAPPATGGYPAGSTATLWAMYLRLALGAALRVAAATPLGAQARQLYGLFTKAGHGDLDFSAIIKMLAGDP